VPDVRVTFFNKEGGVPGQYRSFAAQTAADGSFKITGIYPATYAVSIHPSVPAPTGGSADDEEVEIEPAEVTGPLSRYSTDSPLTAEITESQLTFDFDLTSSR
jgi:hypothetical protein